MIDRIELMQIGKLNLVRESWNWGDILQFEHTELMPSPYSDDEVQTVIDFDSAKELIKHLQQFIDECEGFHK
jgi:hypothetical protein